LSASLRKKLKRKDYFIKFATKLFNMQESILILDFGSQVTQLIGRRLREMNVYCEIHPYNKIPELTPDIKGVILSGSPFSVRDEKAPYVDLSNIKGKLPLLGICYGSQFMAYHFGGDVNGSIAREYGRASLTIVDEACPLFEGVNKVNQVWMLVMVMWPVFYTLVGPLVYLKV
jgi:GMP synthase (glutamine-hydrolysing)